MLTVEKIKESIRDEGLNYGLPTVGVKMGPGADYSTDEVLKQIVYNSKCRWAYIFGEDTLRVGMGILVKGITSCQMLVELECSAKGKDPGWMHLVTRWLVNYVKDGEFNYGALRQTDMIKFTLQRGWGADDFGKVVEGLDSITNFPGSRLLAVPDKQLTPEVFKLARSHEKCRIYVS